MKEINLKGKVMFHNRRFEIKLAIKLKRNEILWKFNRSPRI